MSAPGQMDRLLRRAAEDPDVVAVLLFGSSARGDAGARSDTDVCLVLNAAPRSRADLERRRLGYLADVDASIDVQVFQSLPLYVRTRVLREGKVLFCRDEDALYDAAFATIRAFERFKRTYRAYLDEVARG